MGYKSDFDVFGKVTVVTEEIKINDIVYSVKRNEITSARKGDIIVNYLESCNVIVFVPWKKENELGHFRYFKTDFCGNENLIGFELLKYNTIESVIEFINSNDGLFDRSGMKIEYCFKDIPKKYNNYYFDPFRNDWFIGCGDCDYYRGGFLLKDYVNNELSGLIKSKFFGGGNGIK